MSILARGSSFRRTWSEYSEEKFLSELRPTFVLPMKNSVIKICHTGNISKLLNGGKAIFRSQMFNLRINDGRGGGGWVIYQEKELLPPAVLDKAPGSESSHQLSRAVLHPPVLAPWNNRRDLVFHHPDDDDSVWYNIHGDDEWLVMLMDIIAL